MSTDPLIATYLAALKATRTPATVHLYGSVLLRAVEKLGPTASWSVEGLMDFLGELTAGNHSKNTYLAVLRSFCKLMLPSLDCSAIPSRVKYELSPPRLATAEEVDLLLASDALTPQVKLALMLAADAGLRESEIRGLTGDDVYLEENYLVVHGKGRKRRITPITTERLRQGLTKAPACGMLPVLTSRNGQPLSAGWLSKQIAKASEQVLNHRVSAHGFRHTFAVRSVESGVQMKYIQQALGHASLQVSSRYLEGLMVTAEGMKNAYKGFE